MPRVSRNIMQSFDSAANRRYFLVPRSRVRMLFLLLLLFLLLVVVIVVGVDPPEIAVPILTPLSHFRGIGTSSHALNRNRKIIRRDLA